MLDYQLSDDTAVLRLDDGKANALGHQMIDALGEALTRAAGEAKAVVIAGRDGLFSAGFDLKEFEKGPEATMALVHRGGELLVRLFTHSQPVVVACTGHAMAAGAFLLLTADTRIGADGDFKIALNETAIGMTLPVFGLELAQARLSKRHLTRSAIQATIYGPEEAVDAGFLDGLADPEETVEAAIEEAARLGELPASAYAANKLAFRKETAERIRASLG